MWSDGAASQPAAESASSLVPGEQIDPAGRYRVVATLGRGGMGVVVLADDHVLGRQVAVKVSGRGGGALGRLLQEARLTALLEHGGVVPIYDAGHRSDGTPFYVMKVVRGRTLADAIADARSPEARLALCGPLLEAARAVAFAHHHGVLHRDIKPANMLLGEDGDLQVADWGLARLGDDPGIADDRGPVGTPGYVAPEIAAGQPATAAADVYALGASLLHILTGARPPVGSGSPLARLEDAGDVEAIGPADLRAIVVRAMQTDPAGRYPDAGAFAADLEAWLAGRPVRAHAYTRWQLARRFVAQFRTPLLLGLVAVVASVGALLWGWRASLRERDRAAAAEASTRVAATEAQRRLAVLHAQQAQVAALRGARAEAEILATAALRHGPDDSARGVLVAFSAAPPPRWLERRAFAPCARPQVDAAATAWACLGEGAVRVGRAGTAGRDIPGPAMSAVVESARRRVAIARDLQHAEVHDLDTAARLARVPIATVAGLVWVGDAALAGHNRESVSVVDVDSGAPVVTFACGGGATISAIAAAAAPAVVALCPADGRGGVAWWRAGEGPRWLPVAFAPRGVAAAAMASEATVLVASLDGRLEELSLGPVASMRDLGALDVRDVDEIVVDAELIAVHSGDGGGSVRRRSDGAVLVRLPSVGEGHMRLLPDRTVALVGAERWIWRLPLAARPRIWGDERPGVSALAAGPDGASLLVGRGTGRLERWRVADGSEVEHLRVCRGAVKDIALPGDGRTAWPLCASVADTLVPGPLRVTALAPSGPAVSAVAGRRMVALAAGALLYLDGARTLRAASAAGAHRTLLTGPDLLDLARCPQGASALVVAHQGQVWRVAGDLAFTALAPAPGALAVACGRDAVAWADATSLVLAAADGTPRHRRVPPAPRLLRLATDERGAVFASGHLDGRVLLYRSADGLLVATLRGHAERVGALAFVGPDLLATGSWDGSVRLWGLSALHSPLDGWRAAWPIDLAAAEAAIATLARP